MSFLTSVESFFKKYFANTSWTQTASAAIALTAPSLEALVLAATNAEDAASIQKVVSEVQTDLGVVSQLLVQAQGGTDVKTTITNVLTSVNANLAGLLEAGHIKDEATVTKITALVKAVTGELEAVLSVVK